MPYRIVSLFSGCGGLDYGFHSLDFSTIYSADNDAAAVKCFNHNFTPVAKKVDVNSEEFRNDIKSIGKADVVLGGFPCQGFSKAGPKVKDDPRNTLYLTMLKAVQELSPKVFVAENVDGMAQNFQGHYVSKIKEDFQAIGYDVDYRILNAVDFGVPQFRRRIFFIGVPKNSLQNEIPWPKPTHFGGSRNGEFKTLWDVSRNQLNFLDGQDVQTFLEPTSIGEAIGDLLEISTPLDDHVVSNKWSKKDDIIMSRIGEGQKLCNVRFSNTSVYTWSISEAFGEVTPREVEILEIIGKNRRKKIYGTIPNGNPLSPQIITDLIGFQISVEELEVLAKKGYLKNIKGKYDLKGAMFCSGLYKRPKWNEPSPTVITIFGNPRYFVHPIKDRPFSIRECARLQSFPDSFKFMESGVGVDDAYRLIGNAVAPKVAEQIAKTVSLIIKSQKENEVKESYSKLRVQVSGV